MAVVEAAATAAAHLVALGPRGADPRVALSVLKPDDAYSYLEVRGTVTIQPDPDNAFIDAMARKYTEHDSYPWHQPGDERVVVHVTPEHTTGRIR